jgi:hypothetical protein
LNVRPLVPDADGSGEVQVSAVSKIDRWAIIAPLYVNRATDVNPTIQQISAEPDGYGNDNPSEDVFALRGVHVGSRPSD